MVGALIPQYNARMIFRDEAAYLSDIIISTALLSWLLMQLLPLLSGVFGFTRCTHASPLLDLSIAGFACSSAQWRRLGARLSFTSIANIFWLPPLANEL